MKTWPTTRVIFHASLPVNNFYETTFKLFGPFASPPPPLSAAAPDEIKVGNMPHQLLNQPSGEFPKILSATKYLSGLYTVHHQDIWSTSLYPATERVAWIARFW